MATPHPIRVLIVDDHAATRSALAAFLLAYDDLELAGEAADGREAVDLCTQLQPDVVLMDLVMPEMDGITAIRAIRQSHPHIQVIALTSFSEAELVQGALLAGAIGYLLKTVSADELADAIRAARAGQPTLAPEASQAVYTEMIEHKQAEQTSPPELDLDEDLLKAQSDPDEGIAISDPQTQRLLFMNDALSRIHGYTLEELLALTPPLSLIVPEEQELARERLRQHLAGQNLPDHYKTAIIHKSGARVDIEVIVKRAGLGSGTRLIAYVRDITARQRAEREATDE